MTAIRIRDAVAFVMLLVSSPSAVGGTFAGQSTVTFAVLEKLDGTTTTVSQPGQVNFTLNTNYSTMQWSLSFNVNLVMSGGPSQSFETDLAANGTLTSTRCTGSCDFTSNISSPLSFPDGTGKSGAGSYVLYGSGGWTLTDRIVSTTRVRTSPQKALLGSGFYAGATAANTPGNHYLTVASYPPSVVLTPGASGASAWQDPTTFNWTSVTIASLHLGRYYDPTNSNNYVEVRIPSLPSTVTLTEMPAGDFNSSGHVDAADYVTWRQGTGLLSPFMTSYNVWRNNFGNSASGTAASLSSVPEPTASTLAVILFGLVAVGRRRLA